jgi:hypothetical protein
MSRRHERGEGRVGCFVTLAVLAAILYAAWNIVPVYVANGNLKDKMNEIARTPRGSTTEEQLYDLLMKTVREEALDPYVKRAQFKMSTLETSRRISVEYERPVKVLPGFTHVFRFSNQVDQPLIY